MSRFVTTLAALGIAGGVAFAAAGPASAAPVDGHGHGHGKGGDVFQSCVKEQSSWGVIALNLDLLTNCISNNNWH
ncbi:MULTISPECIES: hypothetical protein [Thermomonosporaceae]|uniref:hypothetical protein n=1 Tax=Thermomonosporaceae TaxID=2012 RepID=UPI00255B39A8|nr:MULTISPECIES: hypothetical protein [Thermomonosporaceae]MDL4774064.1 hypothetical protein [Actinomadura xylanilytica]